MPHQQADGVRDAAQRTLEQAEIIRLTLADQQCFAQALLSPPKPAAGGREPTTRWPALGVLVRQPPIDVYVNVN